MTIIYQNTVTLFLLGVMVLKQRSLKLLNQGWIPSKLVIVTKQKNLGFVGSLFCFVAFIFVFGVLVTFCLLFYSAVAIFPNRYFPSPTPKL